MSDKANARKADTEQTEQQAEELRWRAYLAKRAKVYLASAIRDLEQEGMTGSARTHLETARTLIDDLLNSSKP